jgi:hypothetical protein
LAPIVSPASQKLGIATGREADGICADNRDRKTADSLRLPLASPTSNLRMAIADVILKAEDGKIEAIDAVRALRRAMNDAAKVEG